MNAQHTLQIAIKFDSFFKSPNWKFEGGCSERRTASYRSDVIAYLTPIYVADFTTVEAA